MFLVCNYIVMNGKIISKNTDETCEQKDFCRKINFHIYAFEVPNTQFDFQLCVFTLYRDICSVFIALCKLLINW